MIGADLSRYRGWKSTNNDFEYELKKINFKTLERIAKENIKVAKREYYFKTFTAQKNDMRKTWRTINDTLNSKSNKSIFPTKFIVNNKTITNQKRICRPIQYFLF